MISCIEKLRDDEALRTALGDRGYEAVTRDYLRANLADRMIRAVASRAPAR